MLTFLPLYTLFLFPGMLFSVSSLSGWLIPAHLYDSALLGNL